MLQQRDSNGGATVVRRSDYAAPAYWVDTVSLTFDLDPAKTRVLNKMTLRRNPEVPAQALKLDPKHGHSLFLAGAAAMERGDNKQGIAHWEALLPQVEPGSEIDQMLRSGIDKMKSGK